MVAGSRPPARRWWRWRGRVRRAVAGSRCRAVRGRGAARRRGRVAARGGGSRCRAVRGRGAARCGVAVPRGAGSRCRAVRGRGAARCGVAWRRAVAGLRGGARRRGRGADGATPPYTTCQSHRLARDLVDISAGEMLICTRLVAAGGLWGVLHGSCAGPTLVRLNPPAARGTGGRGGVARRAGEVDRRPDKLGVDHPTCTTRQFTRGAQNVARHACGACATRHGPTRAREMACNAGEPGRRARRRQ